MKSQSISDVKSAARSVLAMTENQDTVWDSDACIVLARFALAVLDAPGISETRMKLADKLSHDESNVASGTVRVLLAEVLRLLAKGTA